MVRNYDREMTEMIRALGPSRPRLLLHACCSPCASSVLERLTPHFDTTVLYYNPNTRPEAEFEKRLYWLRQLLASAPFARGVELLVPEWDEEAFLAAARGLEGEPEGGKRCTRCFELRLQKTADMARAGGYDFFATTLTVSPHKNAVLINALGERLGEETAVAWLPSDFKKRDGYRRSIELSREYGLYRQAWCGCGWPEDARS
ncbi:MAG: epoxyqueuosine reductase QueH [Oscillospiraceae bacterium]|nr:epoxyqueuosine reductase QueH [Oscillospiraceae bacterium]